MTRIINISPTRLDRMLLKEAAQVVLQGGIIGYPTETVYGLGADPFNQTAVKKLYQLKGRDPAKPIGLLISGEEMLRGLVEEIPPVALLLMKRFWPGPLTVVFKAKRELPRQLLGGSSAVALRVSSNPIADGLVDELELPITSSSANISGRAPARSAQEVLGNFHGKVDLVIDGGPSVELIPSTVVDVTTGQVNILRQGRIGIDEIRLAVRSVRSNDP